MHIIGGAPEWISDSVILHSRPVLGTKYATTTGHLEYACNTAAISDPFMLWNDDFYAVEPVTEIPAMHRGELGSVVDRYRARPGAWAEGLLATARHLRVALPGQILYSYEVHVPLIVHKAAMLDALTVARSLGVAAPHKRTIYGNLANLGGIKIQDPKLSRDSHTRPTGPWLSSDDAGFHTHVAPILRGLFPTPCRYER